MYVTDVMHAPPPAGRIRGVGWRRDFFFVSPYLRDKIVATEGCDDVMGSDHCPITLTLDL